MISSYRRILTLVVCTALGAAPGEVPAAAQAANPGDVARAPRRVLSGTANTADGKPLAGATLLFYPEQSDALLGSITAIVVIITDGHGHFTLTLTEPQAKIFGDDTLPACRVQPFDNRWGHYALDTPQGGENAANRQMLSDRTTRKCEVTRAKEGPGTRLNVVVPDVGTVRLKLRGPNGRTLRREKVRLSVPDNYSGSGTAVYETTTDGKGAATWRGFPGQMRLLVFAPAAGFGTTGSFELLPGADATPEVPPLVPFATASGRVPQDLGPEGAIVTSSNFNGGNGQNVSPVRIGASGRFRLVGLLPGTNRLTVKGTKLEARPIEIEVAPGDHLTHLVFKAAPVVVTPKPVRLDPFPAVPKSEVRGRVTDAAGKPVEGADVFAMCSYLGAFRTAYQVLTSRTDADGNYTMSNLPGGYFGGTRVAVVAFHDGYPLAMAPAQYARKASQTTVTTAEKSPGTNPFIFSVPNFEADLTLPSGHTSLKVRVLQDGKPAAGASLRLTQQGDSFVFYDVRPGTRSSDAWKRALRLLRPNGKTDAAGEATFMDIAPGLWDIAAESSPYLKNERGTVAFNRVAGVPVSATAPAQHTLNVLALPDAVDFRFLSPSGAPLAGATAAFQFGPARTYGAHINFKLGASGDGSYSLNQSGLLRIGARFRESGSAAYNTDTEPFIEATGILASSLAMPRTEPLVLRGARREPGSIRVVLEDLQGRRVPGAAVIGNGAGSVRYGLSVDRNGEGIFPAMPSGTYQLQPYFKNIAGMPPIGDRSASFPTDAALTGVGKPVIQSVTVTSGRETVVTLRPQLVGYIRGKVLVAAGGGDKDRPADYDVSPPSPSEVGAAFRYDPETGEFLGGPHTPGRMVFEVRRIQRGGGGTKLGDIAKTIEVEVLPGKVTHVNVPAPTDAAVPPPTQSPQAIRQALMARGRSSGFSDAELSGTVYLPDGVTPAWGAMAALFVPGASYAIRRARSDALGRLNTFDSFYLNTPSIGGTASNPDEPVVVAWLPGSHGATVVPFDFSGDRRFVLPPAASVRGRITVTGEPVDGLNSTFRVLATYQGRSKFNGLLSLDTTAQADGSFELAGLTPGTYSVQAARDGIWVSESKQLIVAADGKTSLTDLGLDIGAPGAAIVLHLANRQGNPLPGCRVTLTQPAGPLADAIWPTEFSTDAAGDLRLEGLGVGVQRVQISREGSPIAQAIEVTVPPFATGSGAVRQNVVVG